MNLVKSSITRSSCVIHDLCFRKPCWHSEYSPLSVMCFTTVSQIKDSSSLGVTHVKLTGLQFPGSDFVPFLKMAVTSADFQSLGIDPLSNDLLKRILRKQPIVCLAPSIPWGVLCQALVRCLGLIYLACLGLPLGLLIHQGRSVFESLGKMG